MVCLVVDGVANGVHTRLMRATPTTVETVKIVMRLTTTVAVAIEGNESDSG